MLNKTKLFADSKNEKHLQIAKMMKNKKNY